MKTTLLAAAAALAISAAAAFAQNASPPAAPGPGNKAVNSPATNNSDKPVSGASFTEGQAKSRIESNGYSKVSDLKKDENGVWRGQATKDGKSTNVSVDFQGNVTSR